MVEESKTKEELLEELKAARQRIRELEASDLARGKADQALRASEAKYRELVQKANSIILRRDTEGRITFFNEFAQRFFGYREDEVLGKHVVGTIVPEKDSYGRDLKSKIEAHGHHPERYTTTENENIRRNGERVWIAWTNSGILDEHGRVVEILCVGNDITEEKRLEEQLFQSQKREAIGRLAGGVVHDFNNLLTIVTGYSEIMLTRIDPDDPLQHMAHQIKTAGERAANLTQQLLSLSGRQVFQPRAIDVNEIVASMEKILKRLVGDAIDLVCDLETSLGVVMIDPSRMEQIILNLVLNAQEAMSEGGTLTIRTEHVDIDAGDRATDASLQPGSYVLLTVSDTGERSRVRMFEPLSSPLEGESGKELGLPVVQGIVKHCGGHILADRDPAGGGSCRVYLPCVQETPSPIRPAASWMESVEGDETVLLTEDDDALRRLLKEVLQQKGYRVLEASDGWEALSICRQKEPPIHLLVTDIVMPGMSGYELGERIASMSPGTKVLYMSGYAERALPGRCVLNPDAVVIEKPFSPSFLVRKVREMLRT
jgi:PAS domain S-box-containing protein